MPFELEMEMRGRRKEAVEVLCYAEMVYTNDEAGVKTNGMFGCY